MTGVVSSTSLCELGPCLVGVWERGRVAGCCCSACLVARCYCMTAGWGETEVLMDVSSRRLARVLHRLLAEHGLLSFLSLLRAFHLNVIKRNQACAFRRAHWLGPCGPWRVYGPPVSSHTYRNNL